MGVINFTGISSGIDSKAIIDATVAAQRIPETALKAKQDGYQTDITNIGSLTSKLSSLSTLAETMGKTDGVLAFDAKTSDDTIATATIDGDVSAGQYAISVDHLAVAEKDRSAAFTSRYSAVKAGTITITVPGQDAVEITINAGDALTDVVDKINASGAGVDASIVSTGSKSYMQLVAHDTGFEVGGNADDAIKIQEDYQDTPDGTALGLTQVTTAKNAVLKVDGLDVEQRSNSLSSVIDGLRVDLKAAGDVTIDVSANQDGTKAKIKAFVDGLNAVLDVIHASTLTKDGAHAVDADSTFDSVANMLRSVVNDGQAGLTGRYTTLSAIGIRTDSTGKFTIDDAALTKALETDMRSVGKLFTTTDKGLSARLVKAINTYADPIDGVLLKRKIAVVQNVADVGKQITTIEDRITKMTATLQKQFTAMEQAMATWQSQASALTGILR